MRGKPIWHHPLAWLLCTSFALAMANGLIIPSFEAMDESGHFNFARYLAEGNGLPDQRDVVLAEEYGYCQEGGQAPLYYLLNAPILRALGGDMSDVATLTVSNPLSTCGDTTQPYSKGQWMRDPWRERWPYKGAALGVHVLRVFGSALSMFTVVGVYMTARAAFPQSRVLALVAAALVGFSPRFVTHSATLTNDNLLAALSAWGVYLAVATLRRGPSVVRSLALGVVTGLASLTKVSGIFLIPLAVLALADVAWREGEWVRTLGHVGLVVLLALLIGGWWYVGNIVRYGDLCLVPLITQASGQRGRWPLYLVAGETVDFLRSYWALSSYCRIPLGYPAVYGTLGLFGLFGGILATRRADRPVRRAVALLLIWALVVFSAWFWFNAKVWAPDGRYLFQAHAAIAPLLAAGLLALLRRFGPRVYGVTWRGLILGMAVLAIITPVGMLAPLFSLPPRYADGQAPIPHPLEASFGDQVTLLGYDVSSEVPRVGGAAGLRPGAVDVTLYLRAERPITEDLTLWLQLVSAGPQDDAVLVNFRSWPGGGNYPTTAWRPGEVIADRYRLRLPADVPALQLWDLQLLWSRPAGREQGQTGEYELLPVRVGGVANDPSLTLTRLLVEPAKGRSSPPPEVVLDSAPAFGPEREVLLEAAEVVPDGADLRVTFWWRARKPLNGEYTVFVQLLDENWNLKASGDGPPRRGAMPTDWWRAGDLIVDEHRVPLPESMPASEGRGDYHIAVGFYDPDRRLPAWDANGEPLPGAAAIIDEWR